MQVGEVAATAAGDQDFLTDAVGVVEQQDAAAATAGVHGTEEARGAGAHDQDVIGPNQI